MELDQLYKRLGRPQAERLAFLEAHPAETESRDDLSIERITLYNQLGRYEEAKALIAARKFHPWEGGEGKITGQYTICHVELAKIALREHRYADALALLLATDQYPYNLGEGKLINAEENDIWYYKGLAYRGLGDEENATLWLHKATQALPNRNRRSSTTMRNRTRFSIRDWLGAHWARKARHADASTSSSSTVRNTCSTTAA